VSNDLALTNELSIAEETGKLSVVEVNWLMHFQFICCTETLWTFIANIWLHAFMSLYVSLNVTFVGEFLLTNVTCEPSAFIV